MMAQDMTKTILVLVLLGACLAVAVFRPQILPPLTPTPASPGGAPPSSGFQAQNNPAQPEPTPVPEGIAQEEELARRGKALDEREAALDQREKELDEWEAALRQREEEVARQEAAVVQREKELDQREAALAERERALDQQEATLAEERAELERLWRWILAVAVVTGMLALPSLFALFLLWKVSRETAEAARATRVTREGISWKTVPTGRPTSVAGAVAGGNGRSQREEVRPRG